MKNNLKIDVNTERLIQNIGSVFSSNLRVILELLQNSRRASATKIIVEAPDLKTLFIQDNGSGVVDLQKLLTLAETGWGEEIQNEESPYGMGFFSALFAAKEVVVESQGKKLTIYSDGNRIANKIELSDSEIVEGTTVRLYDHNIKLDEDMYKLSTFLQENCRGFPVSIDLHINGIYGSRKLTIQNDRSYAKADAQNTPSTLGYSACDVGHIYLKTWDDSWVAYLQGFPVASFDGTHPERNRGTPSVIHLNSSFKARMPDRDTLIDAENEIRRINKAVHSELNRYLTTLLSSKPLALLDKIDVLNAIGAIKLLNYVDALPARSFGISTGMGYRTAADVAMIQYKFRPYRKEPVTRDEVIDGVYFDGVLNDFYDEPYVLALHLALMKRKIPFFVPSLDSSHWYYRAALKAEELVKNVQVEYEALRTGEWDGRKVVVVDKFVVKVPDLKFRVSVKDEALAIEHGDILIIPSGMDSKRAARVLGQAKNWGYCQSCSGTNDPNCGDHNHHIPDRDKEEREFAQYLDLLLEDDASSVLEGIIDQASSEITNSLMGRQFLVTFDENFDKFVQVVDYVEDSSGGTIKAGSR